MNSEGRQGHRVLGRLAGLSSLVFVALLGCLTGTATASTGHGRKEVRYRGYAMVVPAAWPVYDLTRDPTICVRFNRHAVYLGRPSSAQRCPAHAVGRTEAILVEPLAARSARDRGTGPALPAVTAQGAQASRGSAVQLALARRGLIVTATWGGHLEIVQRALGGRSISVRAAGPLRASAAPRQAARGGAATPPGSVFTGLGFDACSAPSPAQMTAWSSSPYHAAGIYIGGTNMACAQPSLTAAWVSAESAAGWHLIPTYVGLQAPTNSCGCAGINPRRAPAEGTAAASDAVAQAQSLGIGTGNPIYFDMEAYPPGGSNTRAVLAFLSAWTTQLHLAGYLSGVYGSGASGMADLAAQFGTGYTEPDDIWIADWNSQRTTSDPYVPSSDWASDQRLHQFQGGHDESHGGVRINIDGDYLDGATVSAVAPPPAAAPVLTIAPGGDGTIRAYASWNGATGVTAWRLLAGVDPGALTPVARTVTLGPRTAFTIHSAFPYFAAQALGSAGQVLAASQPVVTPAHVAIYGRSAFVPSRGLGGLPVGCLTGLSCRIAAVISAGRTVIARTGPEFISAGGGLLYFGLSSRGRSMLSRAPRHRLPVSVTVREASGHSATAALNLIPFVTRGRGPRRRVQESGTLQAVGTSAFVSSGGVGGILAACFDATPCRVRTTISAGRNTIARTGAETVGVNELAYLFFTLTPRGRALLARSPGNHLGAHVTITDPTATASADIALMRFS